MGTTFSDSFGLPTVIEQIEPRLLLSTTLIEEGDVASYLVPTDSSADAVWRDVAYDDSAWDTGQTGIGYERSSGYEALIATDVESEMYGNNETIYIRMPFELGWAGGVTELTLRMKFEDGFVAYINGEQVASHNAPATLAWNSGATAWNDDGAAVAWQDFDAGAGLDHLIPGTNVLAIHGLNRDTTSSDFLILPELVAEMDETHFGVESTDPPDGAFLSAVPASVTFTFSENVNPASIEASDLQIDGQSAAGYTHLAGNTIEFDLPAGLGSGLHSLALADGALTSQGGRSLAAYAGEFRVITTPVVQNQPAASVTHSSATLNGQVVDTGGETPDVHFAWGTTDGGTDVGAWAEDLPLGALDAGDFSADIFDLQADTQYFYRVYASNWAGTVWAPETASFTTEAPQAADVFALPATNVLPFGARLNGEIFDTGGDDPEVHIVWGTEDAGNDPFAWQNDVNLGTMGLEDFHTDLAGLQAETTYYYSVYAINSAGVSWSSISREFTTRGNFPLVTEVMADNETGLTDEDGDYSDWLEIFNPGDTPVDLGGWYLTDDDSDLTQWQLPSVTVPAGEYLVVFASNKDRAVSGQELHTNFALSAGGEYVALVMPDGETVAHDYEFPLQLTDVSFGLTAALTEFRYIATPTPGAENADDYWGYVEPVEISVEHGFYDAPFDVFLSCETSDATIRYTTNGSAPTSDSGTVYTPGTPITITTTTVLRAGAFKPDHQDSVISTESYIFLDDVLLQPNDQSARGMPAQWITASGTTRTADYELDPQIVNDAAYSGMIMDGLLDLPALSLGMDNDDLFDQFTGIYANPRGRGFDWERPVSAEFFDSAGTESFSINAGIRIHGEIARSPTNNPKYPLRLVFRNEYGPGRLEYPLFANSHLERFDTLTLRAHFGSSWISGTSGADYIRNPFLMETFVDTGHPAAHSRLTHLYLNGVYWGIYEISERPDEAFNADYLGGAEEDWDIIKGGISGGVWQGILQEGSKASYDAMMDMVPMAMSQISDAGYQQIKQYLDMENFIDYLIVNMWAQNHDWPQKNWYASSLRDPDSPAGPPLQKFRFYTWDMESTLGWHEQNRTTIGETAGTDMGPGQIYKRIRQHPEFKRLFGDRLQKIFFNDGVMTEAANRARYQAYVDQLDRAIVLESARWGDWRNPSSPYTRNDHWLDRIDYMVGHGWYNRDWMSMRNDVVLEDFRELGLFPGIEAPVYSQHGGEVASGYELQVTGPGPIFYTLDGSDPVDSVTSIPSGGRITLSGIQEVTVKTRAYAGGEWSALNEATFVVGASTDTPGALGISEIMYNPGSMPEADDLEYIELLNTGDVPLLVGGSSLIDGVDQVMPAGTILPADGRALLVGFDPQSEPSKVSAFEAHYDLTPGSVTVLGPYTGVLNNGGERLELVDRGGDSFLSFEYNDGGAWPGKADGAGASLEIIDPLGDYSDPDNWRSSTEYGGSPGAAAMGPITDIVVNEVLTHTDLPDVDSVELYNTTGSPIDIGGWYLSDTSEQLRKYRIPDGTTIGAHGYLVFDEWDFNASQGVDPDDFALNGAHGDDVWLMATNPAGRLTRFVDHAEFEAARVGESFGRWPDGMGDLYPMLTKSLGQANTGPRVGPLVISEVMYNSGESEGVDDLEYVEVYNSTGQTVDLTNWRIRKGIDFDFPAGLLIDPGETVVVLSFNPDNPLNASRVSAFRTHYGIDESVVLVGGYGGKLENGGERVQLQRPDEPPLEEPEYIPHTVEDDIRYDEEAPWPGADGDGNSLHRSDVGAFGGAATGWLADVPSPGSTELVGGVTFLRIFLPEDVWENAGLVVGGGAVGPSRPLNYDIEVTLDVDDTGELSLPTQTVLVPAGQISVPFDLLVIDDDDLDGVQTVTFTAAAEVIESVLPGDANGDGAVTDADYTIWADHYGTQSGATRATGDFNGDGAVTDADYTLWADNYGTVTGLGESPVAPEDGSAEMSVRDDDVAALEISDISGPQTAGQAFFVQIRAADIDGRTVEVYPGPISLSARDAQGPVPVTPQVLEPVAAGMWMGGVTVQAVASGVTLDAQDANGLVGSSNVFDVVSGPFDHYQWSAIADPQYANVPFDVTVEAVDSRGYPVDLDGAMALTADLPTETVGIGQASSVWQFPMRTYYDDSRTQTIYLAEEIGPAARITALSLEVTNAPGQTLEDWTLRMRHTQLAQYDAPAWESEDWGTVYQSDQAAPAPGWVRFEFQTPFVYNGVDNLMVDFSHDNGFRTTTGYCRSTDAGTPRSIVYYTNSTDGSPLAWAGQSPALFTSTQVPDIEMELERIVDVSPDEAIFTDGQWSGQVTLSSEAAEVCLSLDGSSSGVFSVEEAPVLVMPVSATASSHYSLATPAKTIDGSGLSGSPPAAATHSTDWTQMWLSNAEASPTIRFDLGSEVLLTGMHVWNYNQASLTGRGIQSADVWVSTTGIGDPDSDPSEWTRLVDDLLLTEATGQSDYEGEEHLLESSGQTARFVLLTDIENFNGGNYTGLSEIRFYA